MIEKLINKYKDLIPYTIFGVLTTIVNVISYWACAHPLHFPVLISTVIAWLLSVMFAYVTNRKWVFHSNAITGRDICREIISFFGCRVGTELIDILFMWIFASILNFNDMIVKLAANIVVIITNYIASKFIIFKHDK